MESEREFDLFDEYDIHEECSYRLILDYEGKLITSEDQDEKKKLCVCVYKNPYSYTDDEDGKISQASWNYITAGIRNSQHLFCRGELNSNFFNKEKTQKDIDVIFTLSIIEEESESRSHNKNRLIGFSMCVDLQLYEDNHENYSTLYIDSICGNTSGIRNPAKISSDSLWSEPVYNLNDELEPHKKIKVGKILLNIIEMYAIRAGFEQMKLSALSYVINYYRSIGYKHIKARDEPEDETVTELAVNVSKKKFKSEQEVDNQMRIERAIQLCDNNIDKLKENLKLYLDLKKIPNEKETNLYLQKIKPSLSIENLKTEDGKKGIYDLLVKLTQLDFSPNCSGTEIPVRRNWLKNVDGEFISKCIEEGFTMRKSLISEDGWRQLLPI